MSGDESMAKIPYCIGVCFLTCNLNMDLLNKLDFGDFVFSCLEGKPLNYGQIWNRCHVDICSELALALLC